MLCDSCYFAVTVIVSDKVCTDKDCLSDEDVVNLALVDNKIPYR